MEIVRPDYSKFLNFSRSERPVVSEGEMCVQVEGKNAANGILQGTTLQLHEDDRKNLQEIISCLNCTNTTSRVRSDWICPWLVKGTRRVDAGILASLPSQLSSASSSQRRPLPYLELPVDPDVAHVGRRDLAVVVHVKGFQIPKLLVGHLWQVTLYNNLVAALSLSPENEIEAPSWGP
eukprot:766555-Hanusia_phi.AAC.8